MLSVTVHEKLAGVVVQICFVNILSFQFHAVTVTSANNVLIIVIYCSSGLLGNFLEEMDMPLNLFTNDHNPSLSSVTSTSPLTKR